jgi:hypothetical protein
MLLMIAASMIATQCVLAQGVIDEKADTLMLRMSKALEGADTLAFTAETTVDEVLASGQKLQRGALVSALVRRPDRVIATRDGDLGVRKFSYDGKAITVFDPGLGLYATAEVEGSIDDVLAYLREKYDLVLPLGDLIQGGLYEELRPRVTSGRYLGRHRVGRTPCHHVAYTMENVDWQVWVEDGPIPLPRKIVITYKTLPQAPQFTAIIGEWQLSGDMPDSAFELQLPEDASRIEIMAREGGER